MVYLEDQHLRYIRLIALGSMLFYGRDATHNKGYLEIIKKKRLIFNGIAYHNEVLWRTNELTRANER